MSQLPLPNLQQPQPPNRVDVFFRCDGKRANQARFYDDLSLWLTFHIDINQVDMVNFRIDRDDETGGYKVRVYQNGDLSHMFGINPKGKIYRSDTRKEDKNDNA